MSTLESWPFESSSSVPAAPCSFTGSEQWLERARQSLAERHLAPHKGPEIIHLLPELPRTPAGKIWHDRLP
jgi:acyl-coenzyme A synthetase/AMP-(fatty) acid ligase